MKCSKPGCEGTLYRFRPTRLVTVASKSGYDGTLEFGPPQWRLTGMVCDTCGYMEFYTEDPQEVLRLHARHFERTEPR